MGQTTGITGTFHRTRRFLDIVGLAFAATVLSATASKATCETADPEVTHRLVTAYLAPEPPGITATDLEPVDSLDAGRCQQDQFVRALGLSLGPAVGYKVAGTSAPVQARLGLDAPVVGRLLAGMMLGDGAVLDPASGHRLVVEADLLVRVGDAAINQATTVEDVARSLDAVAPFLEVPDLTLTADTPITGPALVAINGGARWGVMGEVIPMDDRTAWVEALATMTATLQDGNGEVLAMGTGSAILGHPLEAVLALRDWLAAEGGELVPGDWISVGSFGPLHPVSPGLVATATYRGWPTGEAQVTVNFSEETH